MGTRFLYGYDMADGVRKASYGQYDGYPDGQGFNMISYIRKHTDKEIEDFAGKIELVQEDKVLTTDELEACIKLGYLEPGEDTTCNGDPMDWYWALRNVQGELEELTKIEKPYMTDDHEFIHDSLFCEFAYLINLKDKTLDYYIGFQKEPAYPDDQKDDQGFYSCKLAKKYPLDQIRSGDMFQIIEEMNVLADY